MPRQTIILNDYSGGICDNPHPRVILDNECQDVVNLNIAEPGRIKTMGKFVVDTGIAVSSILSSTFTVTPDEIPYGYGFFVFSSDYTSTGGADPTDFYVFSGSNNTTHAHRSLYIYDENANSPWSSSINVSTGISAGNYVPEFFYVDGGLRIFDTENESSTLTYNPRWIGYLEGYRFMDNSSGLQYNGWYNVSAWIKSPNHSHSALVASSMDVIFDITNSDPPAVSPIDADDRFTFTINVSTSATGEWTGTFSYYGTFIYDGKQESLPAKCFDTTNVSATGLSRTTGLLATAMGFYGKSTGISNPRITGCKVYLTTYQTTDTSVDLGDLYLLAECDFVRGIRRSSENSFTGWYERTNDNWNCVDWRNTTAIYKVNTYLTETGREALDPSNRVNAETFVVINRMCYAGNVYYDGKWYRDSIFKSFVNQFDNFSPNRRLDIAVGDGESIVKLEAYNDRILEFKERTLYIINVSQDIEFLEGTHPNMGVNGRSAVCKTEYGIVWANKLGCYLYDGSRIYNLLYDRRDQTRRKISYDYWYKHAYLFQSTYTSYISDNYTMNIGYDALNKLVFVNSMGRAKNTLMVYDLAKDCWMRGKLKFSASSSLTAQRCSNFVADFDGKVRFLNLNDYEMYYWDNDPQSTTYIELKTKSIDLGMPMSNKHFVYAGVTYKGTSSNNVARIWMDANEADSYGIVMDRKGTATPYFISQSGYVNTRFDTNDPAGSSNVYSASFKILKSSTASSINSVFEMSDISVTMRPKGRGDR